MRAKRQEISRLDGIGLNGAVLKWIAIISMVVDHFAATIIYPVDLNALTIGGLDLSTVDFSAIYSYSRQFGRLAFPIFAFLMVQGYQHTSNLKRYIGNLVFFALISEVPFDLGFYHLRFYAYHNNIFFTLALGILGLAVYEYFEEKNQIIGQVLTVLVTGWLAEVLYVDYGFYGIALIMGLGILRHKKVPQTIFGVIMGLLQSPAASLAFVPITLYNGERGRQNKWFFYIFYPAHLLFFYLLREYYFWQ